MPSARIHEAVAIEINKDYHFTIEDLKTINEDITLEWIKLDDKCRVMDYKIRNI